MDVLFFEVFVTDHRPSRVLIKRIIVSEKGTPFIALLDHHGVVFVVNGHDTLV